MNLNLFLDDQDTTDPSLQRPPPSYGSNRGADIEPTAEIRTEVSTKHPEGHLGLCNVNEKKMEPGAVTFQQHRHRLDVFFRLAETRISDIRRLRQQKAMGDTRGLLKPWRWFGQKLALLRVEFSAGIRVDFEKYQSLPGGRPQLRDAGRNNVTCMEHTGNECYCVWLYHREDRVCMNWKPFALGKYEKMTYGQECEVHKLYRCYCLWQPSENKGFSTYDLKCLYRPQIY